VGAAAAAVAAAPKKGAATSKKKSKPTDSAKVQARLEANRKAARESRRRKKVLVEELQRSVRLFLCVVFFELLIVVHVMFGVAVAIYDGYMSGPCLIQFISNNN